MKTAKLHITVIELTCPTCGEHLESDSGSHLFQLFEIPDTIRCELCKENLKVPTRAKKLLK